MRTSILFSIILPTFNRPILLAAAVKSVLAQDYGQWELIIIDDGTQLEKKIEHSSIDFPNIQYHYQSNQGKGAARNKGIEMATGDYICFLDDDDTYLPNHLSSFSKAILDHPEVSIFKTGLQGFENGKLFYESKYFEPNDERNKIAFLINNFWLQDLCIKKELAASNQFKKYRLWQDKFYLIPLVQNNAIHQIRKRTVRLNEHDNRSVNLGYKKIEIVAEQRQAVIDAFGQFNLAKSINRSKIINNLLATHFFHAYKYEGFFAAWKYGFQYLKLEPSVTLFLTLLKYQLSSWFKL